jgi:sulfate adenylyltransferase
LNQNDHSLLVAPYGGRLVDLTVPDEARPELVALAHTLPSIQISQRSVCDLTLLACGAFSPLDQFMGRGDYQRVLDELRLRSGHLFPIPITLPVAADARPSLDAKVALRNERNEIIAIMTVDEVYGWDRTEISQKVFGTADPKHPLVSEMERWGEFNLAGRLQVLQLPRSFDFQNLRLTPREARSKLEAMGRGNVVAFQTRNPLHRVHEEMTKQTISQIDGTLLLHPVVGMTKPGDIDHYTRVRSYKILTERYYDPDRIVLALLPLAMRLAGPREAVWHALIRRNYGANHFIVGRDHASPGKDSQGKPFYDAYAAQELVAQHSAELGVRLVPFKELSYFPGHGYAEAGTLAGRAVSISGSQVREEYLQKGRDLPEWFTRPEIAKLLTEAYPPRHQQGFCVWFTGLSGAGKSTTAEILTQLLLEHGRRVTLLDGDVVRTHLSKGLGFSKEDRDTNIRRIGFVAAEIVRHGGAVVCAAVSPYQATRHDVRNMAGPDRFIEVFVDTPLEVCEQRDTKGLYAQARRGEIQCVTGLDDPYERPSQPEIVIDTVVNNAEENARMIVAYLIKDGFVHTGKVDA